jgi:exonuclease III
MFAPYDNGNPVKNNPIKFYLSQCMYITISKSGITTLYTVISAFPPLLYLAHSVTVQYTMCTSNVPVPSVTLPHRKFPGINFSSQNVCSLNVSKPGRKTRAKLAAVTRSGSEIIFLSDVRLNSIKQTASVNDIEKKLKFLGYNMYHNSKHNSRGVAILISTKLNCTVVEKREDVSCNVLLLKITMGDLSVTIGSIYGPNMDDNTFFDFVQENVKNLNSQYTILGGDWNATLDNRNSNNNIDTLNTASIPSLRRSMWLNQLCNTCDLVDPFRYLFPDNREFTYVPFAEHATNRSRLDFFLISNGLVSQVVNCRIPHSLCSLLFDHKQIFLVFRKDNPYKKQNINDSILKDDDLLDTVTITSIECYINHLIPSAVVSDVDIENYKNTIGFLCTLHKELMACRLSLAENGHAEDLQERIVTIRNAIANNLSTLPSIEQLQLSDLSCDRDTFLEVLIISVKNSSLSHQHDFFKIRNANRKQLENRIKNLKKFFRKT